MIAGLEDISAGVIKIGDVIVNDIDPVDRDIAMVFQSYALYPHMTVRENLAFGLTARRIGKLTIGRTIADAAAVLGLAALLDRYPRQLSGGQRQRVAMGRAIVRDPRVFLFDEPLSNLDANLRVQMRIEIKALHQRLRSTVLYVTHDQIEAMTMADRIVLLRDGHVEQIGKPLDLYDHPTSVFVAQFLGSPTMNILSGRVKKGTSSDMVETSDGLTLPLPLDAQTEEGQPIILGLRAEHLTISNDGIPCKIHLTEPLGREILLYGTIGQTSVCIAPGNRPAITRGETVSLRYDTNSACVFDQQSERSIRRGHFR
jgi:multiple sugar transport system ATP-binding protein